MLTFNSPTASAAPWLLISIILLPSGKNFMCIFWLLVPKWPVGSVISADAHFICIESASDDYLLPDRRKRSSGSHILCESLWVSKWKAEDGVHLREDSCGLFLQLSICLLLRTTDDFWQCGNIFCVRMEGVNQASVLFCGFLLHSLLFCGSLQSCSITYWAV